jgi:hypothetical protein
MFWVALSYARCSSFRLGPSLFASRSARTWGSCVFSYPRRSSQTGEDHNARTHISFTFRGFLLGPMTVVLAIRQSLLGQKGLRMLLEIGGPLCAVERCWI